MAKTIEKLADFAVATDVDKLPHTVVQRVRLQHLHLASQIGKDLPEWITDGMQKLAPRRGAARVWGGRTSAPSAAAGLHAARAAYSDRLDHLLGGSTGVGAVCASWALAKGATVAEMIRATAVANEVAGRIGASMLLGPHHGMGAGWVHGVSAAVSAGVMLGLNVQQMANAIGIALSGTGPMPRALLAGSGRSVSISRAVSTGMDAALLAQKGTTASLSQLESPGGLLEAACWLPLHHAFTGLGEAWLTHTISFPRWPGPVVWHAAYDALQLVLDRHIKAADKRLRVDQVLAVHVRLPAPSVAMASWMERAGLHEPASLPHSVRHGMGALIAKHQLGVDEMRAADWEQRQHVYGEVASRVRVQHDLALTLDFMGQAVASVAPLIGGITESEWRQLLERVSRPEVGWPKLTWSDVRSLMNHRPDKWIKQLRFAPLSLSEARLDEWQLRLGAEIEVYTTRGGKWPERRAFPEHSPGTPWSDTIKFVQQQFVRANEARADSWEDVWTGALEASGDGWVEQLLK